MQFSSRHNVSTSGIDGKEPTTALWNVVIIGLRSLRDIKDPSVLLRSTLIGSPGILDLDAPPLEILNRARTGSSKLE